VPFGTPLENEKMPYIAQDKRDVLDATIEELATRLVNTAMEQPDHTTYAGLLNYAITTLVMSVIDKRFGTIRYGILATVTGVLKNVSDELYRRVAAPYEDMQAKKNGDVPLFEEYPLRRM
jgi:hypothetical protein